MTDKQIRQIVCGGAHTFILKESGELFAFGYNYYGQLGLGNNNRNTPTLLMTDKQIRQLFVEHIIHLFSRNLVNYLLLVIIILAN